MSYMSLRPCGERFSGAVSLKHHESLGWVPLPARQYRPTLSCGPPKNLPLPATSKPNAKLIRRPSTFSSSSKSVFPVELVSGWYFRFHGSADLSHRHVLEFHFPADSAPRRSCLAETGLERGQVTEGPRVRLWESNGRPTARTDFAFNLGHVRSC